MSLGIGQGLDLRRAMFSIRKCAGQLAWIFAAGLLTVPACTTQPAQFAIPSPLQPGVYSGEVVSIFRTTTANGTTEDTTRERITIVINSSGIPMVDGAEISAGRNVSVNLGTFTQTINYRSVVVTGEAIVVTSEVTNSNATGGIAIATFRPSGPNAIQYLLDQDIRSDTSRLTVTTTGTLAK